MHDDKVEKSRLGTLLLHKGLISQDQLYRALSMQNKEQLKLGEILIQQGWITSNDLHNSLKKQSRYRIWAAVGAVLLTPLQPFLASTVSADEVAQRPEAMANMQTMSEAEMRETVAQKGFSIDSNDLAQSNEVELNDFTAKDSNLTTLINRLIPGADNLLNAQVSIEGVEYTDSKPESLFQDGNVQLRLPSKIARIALKDIEFKGMHGKHLGDIEISNIRISKETTIKVKIKP